MAIQLHITRTHKTAGNNSDWYTYDRDTKTFVDMAEAKAWLKDEYGTSKRHYMYQDTKDGQTKRIGYIISFKTFPVSYDDKHGFDQHWISFHKLTDLTI